MSEQMVLLRAEQIAGRLHDMGIVTPKELDQAKEELAATQERFSEILVRLGLLRDSEAGKRLASQLGCVPQRVGVRSEASTASACGSAALWSAHRLFPLEVQEGLLILATDDPLSVFALEALGRQCGCALGSVLVREDDFAQLSSCVDAKREDMPKRSKPASALKPEQVDVLSGPAQEQAQRQPPLPASVSTAAMAGAAAEADQPIIKLVDSILNEAIRMRASDIHIEPSRKSLRVRYRVDGVLHDVNRPPLALHGSITSRIKIMAGLNIAEKRLPQDGRLQVVLDERPLDVRLSTLPAMYGESIVMRLLDRNQPVRGLKELGLMPDQETAWEELIHRPHGMVLATGPTGSGKTTTLYTALTMLNQPDRKLITVEDPVEYQLPGVNQVAVRNAVGLTFAAGLRSILRQAPDVIMVGEIRDHETAQIAIQAALTGHLVLSTLHTNDACSAVTRLIDMGIPPFLVASTLQGVLAQRLGRRICSGCRITDNATLDERAVLGSPDIPQVIRSNGCERCHQSGFLGRIGLYELLVLSDSLRELIIRKASLSEIQAKAKSEGMRTLKEDGCEKVREGMTTVAELMRVVATS